VSHKASHYVKHLVKAPDGSKITATQKAILCQLADDHREESGIAFPSMKVLARRSCVSERNCRRLIAALEKSRVLNRIATCRKEGRGQSSNFYIFCALDPPGVAAQLVESGREFLKVPRLLMSGGGGHSAPGGTDALRRERRTPSAAPPGHPAPPIEHLVEPVSNSSLSTQSELNTPISPSEARGRPSSIAPIDGTKAQLQLARIGMRAAIDAVHDALTLLTPLAFENRCGFRNGALEWSEYRFGDLTVNSCEVDHAGAIVLSVSSPDPKATARGLEKYKARWHKALNKSFGRSVQLRLCGNERSAGNPLGQASEEIRQGG
jgi:Helix-turn-helix domain